jgi:hypothetical protein
MAFWYRSSLIVHDGEASSLDCGKPGPRPVRARLTSTLAERDDGFLDSLLRQKGLRPRLRDFARDAPHPTTNYWYHALGT